jgi:chromosome segregation and condensation protein ScpB
MTKVFIILVQRSKVTINEMGRTLGIMKLKIKDVTIHLLEKEDSSMQVLANQQLAEELFTKNKSTQNMPAVLCKQIVKKLSRGQASSQNLIQC